MKISKIYLRICSLLFACFLVCGSILRPVVTYASPYDLMIGSSSNALMTLELDGSDYLVSPLSTLGTVSNTIENDSIQVRVYYYNSSNGQTSWVPVECPLVNGRYQLNYSVLPGRCITLIQPILYSDDMPSPGSYRFSMDYASDFAYDYKYASFGVDKTFSNAAQEHYDLSFPFEWFSGDIYISPKGVNVSPIWRFMLTFAISGDTLTQVGGSFSFHFERVSPDSSFQSMGADTSASDYQNDVSSSLSDLSSSVDSMTEDLSSAAQNLEYISTSQNLIIQGIDNVVMHISDQLFAFWNQLFNLIHVPTMAKMDDIIDAIRNMDLEIEVNLDGLKQSIQQASQNEIANDNKISADQIANDEANTEEVKDAVKEHGNFIIDGLKGLFIPSDEFFKAYFDDLYSYFSDRFGFLSFPIDLVIRIADLFLTSEKVDAVLTLPSFEISGYKVWEDYSFNFTEFLETSFPFLISAIQTVTSIGLIMAFVNLCQDKWNEVMRS